MTNVKLLFEVRFYKFIYLQGRYPEHIVCTMKCYVTVNLIWNKICVRKLLSLFMESWQREVKIHHISFLSQVLKWQLIRTKMSVARDREQILSFCLILPLNLNIYLLLLLVYCFTVEFIGDRWCKHWIREHWPGKDMRVGFEKSSSGISAFIFWKLSPVWEKWHEFCYAEASG